MNVLSITLAATLMIGSAAAAFADARVAPGVVAPDSPRIEANGDVSPAPSQTVTGGVGATEQAFGTPGQTITGGPSGGKGNGGGGS